MTSSRKTVLVVGGSGFLGGHVCRHFQSAAWKVVSIGRGAQASSDIEHVSVSIPHAKTRELLRHYKPELCVNCAGRSSVAMSVSDPHGDFIANSALTAAILEDIRVASPTCKFITVSSASVYGNPERFPICEDEQLIPVSAYGYHKYIEELLCQEYAHLHGVRTAVARVFSAYGAGLRRQVIWDVTCKALTSNTGTVVLRGKGSESRDFIHGSDVAQAIELIAAHGNLHGEPYNVATGIEVPIANLAQQIIEIVRPGLKVEFDGVGSDGYAHRWQADIGRIQQLGFQVSVDFKNGLEEVAAACRESNREHKYAV